MQQYPEKANKIDKLIMSKVSKKATIEGKKTQQRRHGVYGYPGERFNLDGVEFEITDLQQGKLGDMKDDDALAEGYDSMEAYQERIMMMHKGRPWNPGAELWVHKFRRSGQASSGA